jgi:hypothetical protein
VFGWDEREAGSGPCVGEWRSAGEMMVRQRKFWHAEWARIVGDRSWAGPNLVPVHPWLIRSTIVLQWVHKSVTFLVYLGFQNGFLEK